MLSDLFWIAGAYLAGSVPFGYLWVRLARCEDIRKIGSGNIGATNVARVTGSRAAGACVFLLDVVKGWAPVWIWTRLRAGESGAAFDQITMGIGLAAIAGHLFPCWLSFRGGKGVATGLGVLAALFPLAAALALAVWILSALLTRYVSVSSVLAAFSLPLWLFMGWTGSPRQGPRWEGFSIVCAAVVVAKHQANLHRLAAGTEPKIGQKETGDRSLESGA